MKSGKAALRGKGPTTAALLPEERQALAGKYEISRATIVGIRDVVAAVR